MDKVDGVSEVSLWDRHQKLERDSQILRTLLWNYHGCTLKYLKKQGQARICDRCGLDFMSAGAGVLLAKFESFRTSSDKLVGTD